MTTNIKQKAMDIFVREIDFPIPLISPTPIEKIKLDWVAEELTAANETIATLLQSYKRLAVAWHVAKAGGTSSHAGSFEHCENKVCKEHRKILESVR